jgi:hypothetical protein
MVEPPFKISRYRHVRRLYKSSRFNLIDYPGQFPFSILASTPYGDAFLAAATVSVSPKVNPDGPGLL